MSGGNSTLYKPAIIAHGGAWDIPQELCEPAIDGCAEAAGAGWDILVNGGTAVEAVETAVRVLEDDPTFDAGRGSVLNAAGEIELDAIIMDGRDLDLGAVMAVRNIRHPVTLARLVMSQSEHAVLVCEGAEAFARNHGLPFCPIWELVVDREVERWRSEASRPEQDDSGRRVGRPCDTVGAVAIDVDGHLAAATSTGGTSNKHPGRVGDSPLVGSGAYADDRTGAASATGDGEQLMRIVISKTACDFLAREMTAQEAAEAAIALLTARTDGEGGLIVLGRRGDAGIAHNTSCLAYAHIVEGRMRKGIHA
jgi:beta-aspartyl-peptidase (threonine type)